MILINLQRSTISRIGKLKKKKEKMGIEMVTQIEWWNSEKHLVQKITNCNTTVIEGKYFCKKRIFDQLQRKRKKEGKIQEEKWKRNYCSGDINLLMIGKLGTKIL